MAKMQGSKTSEFKANEIPCRACKKPIQLDTRQCEHCGKNFSEKEVEDRIRNAWMLPLGCLAILVPIAFVGYCAMQPSEAEIATETQRQIAEREKGLHCLDGINGESSLVVFQTEARLRDPSSFEHVETRIGPRKTIGTHTLIMKYRARNGFGGMTIGSVSAEVNSFDCSIASIELDR